MTGGAEYSTVAVVHCETSSGVMNDVAAVGQLVRSLQPQAMYLVDAMSSFGAVPLDTSNVDFIVSSANKCLQVSNHEHCSPSTILLCRVFPDSPTQSQESQLWPSVKATADLLAWTCLIKRRTCSAPNSSDSLLQPTQFLHSDKH